MRRVLLLVLIAVGLLGVLALTTGPVPREAQDRFTELANALAFRLGGYRLSEADA